MEKESRNEKNSGKKDELVQDRYASNDKTRNDNNKSKEDRESNNNDNNDDSKEDETPSSICDRMKDDTSDVIQKLESKIPTLAQNYSDLYNAYLHMLDDIHGTCCISEKEFVDKMNIDPKTVEESKKYLDVMKNNSLKSIEMTTTLYDAYVKMRISMIKSFDSYAHVWMESYGKMLSEFTKNADKWNKTN